MADVSAPEIVDVMEGEFAQLLDLVMSRYTVKNLVTPQNSLREWDPATIRDLAPCLHGYLRDFQDSRATHAETPGASVPDADVTTAPVVQQVLNLRCRVILDNDLSTMAALRGHGSHGGVAHRPGHARRAGELDTIIDELRAADFEAAFTSQVTVEPADQSQRELARSIGETRQ